MLSGRKPLSNFDIKSNGVSIVLSEDDSLSVEVEIYDLIPDTNYDIYCYTEDFASREMDFSEVIDNPYKFKTDCCRSIKFSNVKTTIDQYDSETTNKIISPIFSFYLESLPSSD